MSRIKIKIITFISAVLLLFGFVVTPLQTSTLRIVQADTYLDPYEELKQSKGFNETSLALCYDITLIDLVEYWQSDEQVYPTLYLYVYNPTSKELKDSTDNYISIRTGDSEHWNRYKIDWLKSTSGGRYVKYVVKDLDVIYNTHPDKEKRYYDVSEVKLVCGDDRTPSTIRPGFKYLYTGRSELSVEKEKYEVIPATNLEFMLYRNLVSGERFYKDGQINSLAFSLSKDVSEKYGSISEIHFDYYRYKTSPIVVSDERNGVNIHKLRNEWIGKSPATKLVLRWGVEKYTGSKGNTYLEKTDYGYGWDKHSIEIKVKEYDKLCYSFSSGSLQANKYVVTSKQLEDWVYSYAGEYLQGQEYESLPVKDGRLPVELFEDVNDDKYGYKDVCIKAETLTYKDNYDKNWWELLFGLNTSYNSEYDTIQEIDIGKLKSLSKESFCDVYKLMKSITIIWQRQLYLRIY